MVLRQEARLPQQEQGRKILLPSKPQARMQVAPQKGEEMKHLILILLCLIAFIPKVEYDKNPEVFLEALMQIYYEKHPGTDCGRQVGCKPPTVSIGENKLGQIVVIIDHPKQEV